jgi:hypothetical protein
MNEIFFDFKQRNFYSNKCELIHFLKKWSRDNEMTSPI